MVSAAFRSRRVLLALVAFAAYAAVCVLGCGPSTPPTTPPPPEQALPADIEQQVHTFCGGSCHAYPPPDSFPRRHWRAEVERGFSFFDKSGMALSPPKLAHVVKYYEDRAPEDYPP